MFDNNYDFKNRSNNPRHINVAITIWISWCKILFTSNVN